MATSDINLKDVSRVALTLATLAVLASCGGDSSSDASSSDGNSSNVADSGDDGSTNNDGAIADTPNIDDLIDETPSSAICTLHDAFLDFGHNVEIIFNSDECTVTIEATGKPDHTSPYWDPNGASGLYVEPGPETDVSQMSPGFIDDFGEQLYTMTVPAQPQRAASTTATSLGAVGIAVSGAPIFNGQEGPNRNLDIGVISGFDINGAHTGPEVYHYHLEPKSISDDDDQLIGIMADGFFIYGRRDYTDGDYPTDLDESGGHVGITQHTGTSDEDAEYHYHVQDEFYLGSYYLLFPDDYAGTPVNISR